LYKNGEQESPEKIMTERRGRKEVENNERTREERRRWNQRRKFIEKIFT
jgi:hypothetical protein